MNDTSLHSYLPTTVIDLTMEDDSPASPERSTLRESAIKPEFQEPMPTVDYDTEVVLPDLPPSELDEDASADQLDESFEQDLQSMLAAYNTNSAAERTPPSDYEYEDALTAVEKKRVEIARKESFEENVSTERIQLKSLEYALAQAEKRRNKVEAYEKRLVEENSMFIPEGPVSDDDVEMSRAPTRQEAMNTSDASEHIEISNDDDQRVPKTSRAGRGRGKGKTCRGGRKAAISDKTATVGKTKVQKRAAPVRRGGQRADANVPTLNMGSMMRNDIVGDARRNQSAGEQPTFGGTKNRKDALTALIASIPQEHQDTSYGMKTKLNNACKQFKWKGPGSMKPDPKTGGWRLKGMSSSLKHFQLIAAAWGCEREAGSSAPYGGILADTMGYGKTVQMISIMVENQPRPQGVNKTTLIVVPSSIASQWAFEIGKHTEEGVMDPIVYRSGSRIDSVDVVKILRKHAVIITTYHEVMRNYPKCEPPIHLTSDTLKDLWWKKHYEENKGPLLRMKFFRIVLDEAQLIKNHESRTSKACRLLSSKYRWVLTGTPLSNCMEEFFPYFEFLRVEGAGDYRQFKHNYAQRNDATMKRLDAMLRKIMMRRTLEDRMFGAPLTTLPALDHQTVQLNFNPVEKAIYSVIRQRFITLINTWSTSGKLAHVSRNIFVMLTRLRQMCAHILIVSTTMRNLFQLEDIEKIWKAIERYSEVEHEDGKKTAKILQRIWKEKADEKKEARNTPTVVDLEGSDTIDLTINDSDFDFRGLFYRMEQDGSWAWIQQRSSCNSCNDVPTDAKVADPCGHLYCSNCIRILLESAAQLKQDHPTCVTCQIIISDAADLRALKQIANENLHAPGPSSFFRRSSQSPQEGRAKLKGKAKKDEDISWLSIPGADLMSTKMQAVMSTLSEWINKDPNAKIVVFTLFIPVVKILGMICHRNGWGYREFTGEQRTEQRNNALKDFKEIKLDQDSGNEIKVLLMSMRAGGLGLNLVESSYVIIVDPWWNEPMENQAFSRVYRIGQRRDCLVRRFVIADAVDTQLMHYLQKQKAQECDRVVDGRSNQELSVHDLIEMFGPTDRDPQTGEAVVTEGEEGDPDDFQISNDQAVQDHSDSEEVSAAPTRLRE